MLFGAVPMPLSRPFQSVPVSGINGNNYSVLWESGNGSPRSDVSVRDRRGSRRFLRGGASTWNAADDGEPKSRRPRRSPARPSTDANDAKGDVDGHRPDVFPTLPSAARRTRRIRTAGF